MNTILVTGGCGFIGSNFVRRILRTTRDYRVINLDALTYAGNPENLRQYASDPRYVFVHGSICDRATVTKLFTENDIRQVVHFAAESHVDRSITDPSVFAETNVLGTQVLLEQARKRWGEDLSQRCFVHVSTDEVYGALGATGFFTETTPLAPNSPYSASKAGSDLLARAYFHTFDLPVIITRCSNNYGPYQFPEKLIPLMILNALDDKPLPVYGDGLYTRDWLHVEDHCAAIQAAMSKGTAGEVYNIGGNNEQKNIEIVTRVLDRLGKPHSLIRHVTDRPGHDRRYAIDATKAAAHLGWRPEIAFADGIASTIDWYVSNQAWWEPLRATNRSGS